MAGGRKKLVLAVVDGVRPAMLDRAVATDRAPALRRLMEDGVYLDDCVASFPSVTPVCAATIATGAELDRHLIPSMNWYHRGDERYVEYGSSFSATRAFGIQRSLTDTVYNLNLAHLARDVETVFERLDDADVRTAGTTYLIYRGRHRHEAASESALGRLVTATILPHGVWGPRELFYADLFASRRTGCRGALGMPGARDEQTGCVGSYLVYRGRTRHEPAVEGMYPRIARAAQFTYATWGPGELFYADLFASRETGCTSALGMPGQRDQHTGCVGAHLVERDLFDFLLFSLPDNDTHSHRRGPYAQVTSIASADHALERIMHVAGGIDAFLADHAVILMSDHSQTAVEDRVSLGDAFDDMQVLSPADADPSAAELAVCPVGRFAGIYVLDHERRAEVATRAADRALGVDGVDLCARWGDDRSEAVVRSAQGELRFAAGGELVDPRGWGWSVEGDLGVLGLAVEDCRVRSRTYPDALRRLWTALSCRNSGDVLLSAAPGYEFADWGGADHVGGGSHGSLHRHDSLGAILACGLEGAGAREREQWSIEDASPLVLEHFGVADEVEVDPVG